MPAALYSVRHSGTGVGFVDDPHLTHRILQADTRIVIGEYAIDYSFLDQIPRIPYREKGDLKLWEDKIDRRTVLVGDLSDVDDSRCTALRPEPLPGVLIHACAFATLDRGLLWHIEQRTSFLCDLGLLLFVIAGVGSVRHAQVYVQALSGLDAHAVEILSFVGAAILVLFVSVVFIGISHFFWPEFLWIALGFFLHPYLAEVCRVLIRGAKGFLFSAARSEGPTHAD
jgi:CHASE2 domain-containing sensor protein